ncbi:hypothetical protein RF11_16296 [Thelohanellus kitauei]|uniref:Uncharacterized protein n=1 Tax=Thelohanellus kitauei TaxID=669202 RepID=A0A0C2N436_THEKT|nr:hypothetical protein RF11_16296 [Thelohanellus kitauei]
MDVLKSLVLQLKRFEEKVNFTYYLTHFQHDDKSWIRRRGLILEFNAECFLDTVVTNENGPFLSLKGSKMMNIVLEKEICLPGLASILGRHDFMLGHILLT